ncbi:MAG: hypothetical protein AAB775_02075 [Patescibacteria group bacterium]
MKKSFLKKIAPFLWSYDVDKMDADRDKKRIITNVLNLGTKSAVEELFQTYKKSEIKEVVEKPLPGEWNEKSLNFWNTILDIESKRSERKIV